MHPLGIVLAFLGFGLVSGLGLFIVINTASALSRQLTTNLGLISTTRLRQSLALFMFTCLLLLGLALITAGGYATYKVIYG